MTIRRLSSQSCAGVYAFVSFCFFWFTAVLQIEAIVAACVDAHKSKQFAPFARLKPAALRGVHSASHDGPFVTSDLADHYEPTRIKSALSFAEFVRNGAPAVAGKPGVCEIAVVDGAPGTGKTRFAQDAFRMGDSLAAHDAWAADRFSGTLATPQSACTHVLSLFVTFNDRMDQYKCATQLALPLASRIALQFFCGFPREQAAHLVVAIDEKLKALAASLSCADDVAFVPLLLQALEVGFAAQRGIDRTQVHVQLLIDEPAVIGEKHAYAVATAVADNKAVHQVNGVQAYSRHVVLLTSLWSASVCSLKRSLHRSALQAMDVESSAFLAALPDMLRAAAGRPTEEFSRSVLRAVQRALAVTGGHARAIEMTLAAIGPGDLTRGQLYASVVRTRVAASFGNKFNAHHADDVFSFLAGALLGAKCDVASEQFRDVARSLPLTNTQPEGKVVPVPCLLSVLSWPESWSPFELRLLKSVVDLLAKRTDAFEEATVLLLALKLRYHAVRVLGRCWPEAFPHSDRLYLVADDSSTALFPRPQLLYTPKGMQSACDVEFFRPSSHCYFPRIFEIAGSLWDATWTAADPSQTRLKVVDDMRTGVLSARSCTLVCGRSSGSLLVLKDKDERPHVVVVTATLRPRKALDIVPQVAGELKRLFEAAFCNHPLRRLGIDGHDQVTLVILAPRASSFDERSLTGVPFRVAVLSDEDVRTFFTPTLAPLAYLATARTKKIKR